MFSWKSKFRDESASLPRSVSETSSNQGFAQFGPKKFENDYFCQKKVPAIPRRFLRRLRRFLRHPATFSATPCDVLRRPGTLFGGFWPIVSFSATSFPYFGKQGITSQNFRSHVWFAPGLMKIWTRKRSLWQKLRCCTVWQNQIGHFDDMFVLFRDPIANLHPLSFLKTPLTVFSETSSTCQGTCVLTSSPWFESMTAVQRKNMKVWGEVYMLDELPKIGSFKALQNRETFSGEPMLKAFWFILRTQQKSDNLQYLALMKYILK